VTSFIDEFMCSLPAWRAEKIGEVNLEKALEVLESNVDGYYMDKKGELPTCENLRQDIQALPPGCTGKDKSFLLLYKDGYPAAIVDYVENYPDSQTGYVGLFLLSRSIHRQGWGQKLFASLEQAAIKTGKNRLELGCYEANRSGLAFWKSMGFREIRRQGRKGRDGVERQLLSMEKLLCQKISKNH